MLDRYCERLAKEWDIPQGFATDTTGTYVIPLEENLEVVLKNIEGGFTLRSVLGPCPNSNKTKTYIDLLAGNTLGQSTKGASLSLDENNHVVLSQTITFFCQYRDFYEILEDFIDTADNLQAIIKDTTE